MAQIGTAYKKIMTTQFLILRIQSILEGKADLDASQMRAIASEYRRLCEDAERRLIHCASLIRAGRDHAALQIAETEPQLLESINELLFPELADWSAFCKSNALPNPPAFNDSQIALVKSLYTHEISENHPLYRDYRRAMRMHKYEQALLIIRTISKVNMHDAAARQECERLRKRLVIDKFYQAKDAWLEGRQNEALAIAKEIKADADLMVHDVVWRTIADKLEQFEIDEAKKRIAEIGAELRTLETSDDYRKVLALGAECDLLALNFSIKTSVADSDFVKSQMLRAGKLQDEAFAKEQKVSAARTLSAEVSNPLNRKPSIYLKELEDLKKRADDLLDPETDAKLKPLLAKLKTRVLLVKTLRVTAFATIAIIVGYGAHIGYKAHLMQSRLNDANNLVSALRNSNTLKDAMERQTAFMEKYPDFLNSQAIKNDIENISARIVDLEMRAQRLGENFKALENFDTTSNDASEWSEIFDRIQKMRDDAEKFFAREQDSYLEKIAEQATILTGAREKKRAQFGAELDVLLTDAAKSISAVDFFDASSKMLLKDAAKSIGYAKAIVDMPPAVFTPAEASIIKFETLSADLKKAERDMEYFEAILSEMSQAENLKNFNELIDELFELKAVNAEKRRQLSNIADKRDEIMFHVYGGIVEPELAANAPEEFRTVMLDFTGEEIAGRIHKHSDGKKTIYTDGKLTVRKQSWKGGSETIQEAAEISPTGAVTNVIYRLNETEGLKPRGVILQEGGLSPESQLIRQVTQISSEASALKAMEIISNAECNPVFKVWLEKKLLDEMRKDPAKSGLAFSESLNARAKRIDNLSSELSPQSWIYSTPSRTNLIKSELYASKTPDYLAEASEKLAKTRNAYNNPMKLSGYVAANGNFVMNSPAHPVFGLDTQGKFRQIKEGEGAPFSPLFKK